jgi:hypothetical protein
MTVSGVEFRDIASGKIARVVPLASGGYNILANGPNLPTGGKRPCRALSLPEGGSLTITGLDGVSVALPDPGGAWQWNIQAIAITGGTATNVVVLY